MAVKTAESATATVKLVGAADDFSDSESDPELQDDVKKEMKKDHNVLANDIVNKAVNEIPTKEQSNPKPRGASTSPMKERFNPFNKESYDEEKQQFPQLRSSTNSSHSGTQQCLQLVFELLYLFKLCKYE